MGVEDVMKRHDALGGKCRKGDERMSQNGERKSTGASWCLSDIKP